MVVHHRQSNSRVEVVLMECPKNHVSLPQRFFVLWCTTGSGMSSHDVGL